MAHHRDSGIPILFGSAVFEGLSRVCVCDVGDGSIATAEASVFVDADAALGPPNHSRFSILFVAYVAQMATFVEDTVKSRMIIQFKEASTFRGIRIKRCGYSASCI